MQKESCLSQGFAELKEKLLKWLLDVRYSDSTMSSYLRAIGRLEDFMARQGATTYSVEIGRACIDEKTKIGGIDLKSLKTTVRRMNEMIGMASANLRVRQDNHENPAFFQNQLDGYVDYLRMRGVRKSTIGTYVRYNRDVLHQFYSCGIRILAELRPTDIYAAFEASTCKAGFATPVKSFLKYLFKKDLHDSDLSLIVPIMRRSKPVPSVYSKRETEKILSSIDRSKPIGKRDYAAILLALRLGMRAGDIIGLKNSDINHEARVIEFVQEKTLVPQRLELLPEIEDALTAYLSERANPQGSPYVFLSVIAPFGPLIGNVVGLAVTKHIEIAGIKPGERKRGSHAMRMTLASELAAEDVPYDVIRKILGHENPESISHYVKLDIEMLRKCALDAPQPVGRLAECLRSAMGGVE